MVPQSESDTSKSSLDSKLPTSVLNAALSKLNVEV
jgi:hypothetical protein